MKQLSKNPELMKALGYDDKRQLDDSVKLGQSKKDGFFMWNEFLDFFFSGQQKDRPEGSDWWNQLDSKGNYIVKAKVTSGREATSEKKTGEVNASSPGHAGKSSPDRRPVKITPSIQML